MLVGCEYIYICYAFVDLDNKLYKMHGMYIKIKEKSYALFNQ